MVRQRAGRTPLWMLQFLRTWRNSRRVGPRSRWTKVHEGAIPSVRTNLSRRGWNVDTADSKSAGRHCPCRCNSGRRDQFRGRAWNSRPGGLKNRRAASARERASRSGRTNFFGEWWNGYTRVSETRERKLVQVRILSRRPISMATSNKSSSPASQAGHRSAILRVATTFAA